jgi:hypothetical protein
VRTNSSTDHRYLRGIAKKESGENRFRQSNIPAKFVNHFFGKIAKIGTNKIS